MLSCAELHLIVFYANLNCLFEIERFRSKKNYEIDVEHNPHDSRDARGGEREKLMLSPIKKDILFFFSDCAANMDDATERLNR